MKYTHMKTPPYTSFKYNSYTVFPPSAYIDGEDWKQHLRILSTQLGRPYEILYDYIGYEYFRYALYNIKDDKFPVHTIGKIIRLYKQNYIPKAYPAQK